MLRDAGMHVAYPGRITYNYDQDARRSLVVCGFRSAFRSSEQVCSLARDVSHGLLTNSHFVRSPEGPNNQNTERGDRGMITAGSRSASEPDRVAG